MREIEIRFKPGVTNYSTNHYASDQPKFAFVSKFENKKVRLLTTFQNCREYFCQHFLKRVRRSWPSNSWASEIDIKRVRIATYVSCGRSTKEKALERRAQADAKMKTVVRMLNLIEKEAGWPLTKLYRLNHSSLHHTVFMYMLVGSGKWQRSQHILSLYSLLVRCIYMNANFSRVRKYSGLKKVADKYRTGEYKLPGSTQKRNDLTRFKHFDTYLAILRNFDTIFKGLPVSRNYSVKAIGSQDLCFTDGISNLLKGHSKDTLLKERIDGIFEKEN